MDFRIKSKYTKEGKSKQAPENLIPVVDKTVIKESFSGPKAGQNIRLVLDLRHGDFMMMRGTNLQVKAEV